MPPFVGRFCAGASRGLRLAAAARARQNRATSLRAASLDPFSVEELDLGGSKDFVCTEMVCAHFGSVCVCKLARWLFQAGPSLTSLRTLKINGNGLTTVPDPVWSLTQIEVLDLSSNRLEGLPDELANLTNLRKLDLSNNLLSKTPEAVERLFSANPALDVNLDGNPCASPAPR